MNKRISREHGRGVNSYINSQSIDYSNEAAGDTGLWELSKALLTTKDLPQVTGKGNTKNI